ncbi:MAG: ARMT1-like domain-containing protein, partial [Candidatus Helarchaeota archaeon]|nr:ARMT1-like domain-containing protein [Candidatus Helarchaeota archaeon]
IADNAGEVFFDLFLLKLLKKFRVKTILVVKSTPVSNDATMDDVSDPVFKAVATKVMTTGTNALGVSIIESSQEFLKSLQTADFIIAKGQSNFETLFYYAKQLTDKPIYFLFRAKCPAIAHFLGQTVGKNVVLLRRSE